MAFSTREFKNITTLPENSTSTKHESTSRIVSFIPMFSNPEILTADNNYYNNDGTLFQKLPALPSFQIQEKTTMNTEEVKPLDSNIMHLNFDKDVFMERAPVESFLEHLNKKFDSLHTCTKIDDPIFENIIKKESLVIENTTAAAIHSVLIKSKVDDELESLLSSEIHKISTSKQEPPRCTENPEKVNRTLNISRPHVAYKDIVSEKEWNAPYTLSNITQQCLKKLTKGNTLQAAFSPEPRFQDVSGLIHYNKIKVPKQIPTEELIKNIENGKYAYQTFDYLGKPLITVNEKPASNVENKNLTVETEKVIVESEGFNSHQETYFYSDFLSLLKFEYRTNGYTEIGAYVPLVASLKSEPENESLEFKRIIELIIKVMSLDVSTELQIECIKIYDQLVGINNLSARSKLVFRDRIRLSLDSITGDTRVFMAKVYLKCAGDRNHTLKIFIMEGCYEDVANLIKEHSYLLMHGLKHIHADLKSAAPFDRIRALKLISFILKPTTLPKLSLALILNNENEKDETNLAIKKLLEDITVMAWDDWVEQIRNLCIATLSILGLDSEINRGIMIQVHSQEVTKQITAIERIGKFQVSQGLDHLRPCLESPHFLVRRAAFEALSMFKQISDRAIINGLFVGCTDVNEQIRIAALRALRQIGIVNAQLRETLYYLLHYDPVESVRAEVISSIKKLGLIPHFLESLHLIHANSTGQIQESVSAALSQAGFYLNKVEDAQSFTPHSELLMRTALYDKLNAKDKDAVTRYDLVSEMEEEKLLKRVKDMCTKNRIISEATMTEYHPLFI